MAGFSIYARKRKSGKPVFLCTIQKTGRFLFCCKKYRLRYEKICCKMG